MKEKRCGWGPDTGPSCYGCHWICHCTGKQSLLCRRANIACYTYSSSWYVDAEPPREKYVCLDCHHIWKSKYTKYQRRQIEPVQYRKGIRFAGARCGRCGKDGILVGRNFRHCKTTREWEKLQENVENGTIVLFGDFDFARTKHVPGKVLPENPYGVKLFTV
jgi:hypothetical protein